MRSQRQRQSSKDSSSSSSLQPQHHNYHTHQNHSSSPSYYSGALSSATPATADTLSISNDTTKSSSSNSIVGRPKTALECLAEQDILTACSPFSAKLRRRVCHLGVVRSAASEDAAKLLAFSSPVTSTVVGSGDGAVSSSSSASPPPPTQQNTANSGPSHRDSAAADSPFYRSGREGEDKTNRNSSSETQTTNSNTSTPPPPPSSSSPSPSTSAQATAAATASTRRAKALALERIIEKSNEVNHHQRRQDTLKRYMPKLGDQQHHQNHQDEEGRDDREAQDWNGTVNNSTAPASLLASSSTLRATTSPVSPPPPPQLSSASPSRPALYPLRSHFEYRPYCSFELYEQNAHEAALRSHYGGEGQPPPPILYRQDPERNQHMTHALFHKKQLRKGKARGLETLGGGGEGGEGDDGDHNDSNTVVEDNGRRSSSGGGGGPAGGGGGIEAPTAYAVSGATDVTAHLVSRPNFDFSSNRFSNRSPLYLEYLKTSADYFSEVLGVDPTSPLPTEAEERMGVVRGWGGGRGGGSSSPPRPATSMSYFGNNNNITGSSAHQQQYYSTTTPTRSGGRGGDLPPRSSISSRHSQTTTTPMALNSRSAVRAQSAGLALEKVVAKSRMIPLSPRGGNVHDSLSNDKMIEELMLMGNGGEKGEEGGGEAGGRASNSRGGGGLPTSPFGGSRVGSPPSSPCRQQQQHGMRLTALRTAMVTTAAASTPLPRQAALSRSRNVSTLANFNERGGRPMTSTEVARQQRAASSSQHRVFVTSRLKDLRELQHLTRQDHPLRTTVYC